MRACEDDAGEVGIGEVGADEDGAGEDGARFQCRAAHGITLTPGTKPAR